MRRADQHGPPPWSQSTRPAGVRQRPLWALEAAERARRIGLDGFIAGMSVEAPPTAPSSLLISTCLEQVRLPALRQRKPDAVLVMDNLRAHKTPQVQAVLEGSGFTYRYLPAYSPDLNPIEPGRAKVRPAPSRRTHHRGTRTGGRSGSRHHHRPERHRLLQILRLCPSQIECDLL